MTILFPSAAGHSAWTDGQKFVLRAKPAPINRVPYRRDDDRREGAVAVFSSHLQKNVLTFDMELLT
jgi:hypothetical protein